jgi:hypothetical protein
LKELWVRGAERGSARERVYVASPPPSSPSFSFENPRLQSHTIVTTLFETQNVFKKERNVRGKRRKEKERKRQRKIEG